MTRQPTKTDNKSVENKIFIRKKAIEGLEKVNVLDLFAGRNVLWGNIKTDKYYGVDLSADKGRNLYADSHKVFDSLDLCQYNIIDVDSYGISFDIFKKLLERTDINDGTIVFYTAITNEFTKIRNEAKQEFGFKTFYDRAPSLFNARAIEFFYEILGKYGVKEVNYYEVRDHFLKHYGYFIIQR